MPLRAERQHTKKYLLLSLAMVRILLEDRMKSWQTFFRHNVLQTHKKNGKITKALYFMCTHPEPRETAQCNGMSVERPCESTTEPATTSQTVFVSGSTAIKPCTT